MRYNVGGLIAWVRLNPCCSGIGSVRLHLMSVEGLSASLNPCCSGIGSVSTVKPTKATAENVLILVVVELAL